MTQRRAVDDWLGKHADELLATAAELTRIPSENRPPTGDELVAQAAFKRILHGHGAEVDFFFLDEVAGLREHPAYLPGRDYAARPNVVGRFAGSGGGRSLLFSSHMDTAARDPLPWRESEPFSGEVRDGRLWGRGSFDMKGGLVASLYGALAARATAPLRGDVLIESVVDEEWGGGNGTLAARMRGHTADAAILPEPTALAVHPEHLGCRIYRLTIAGSAGMRFGNDALRNPIELGARVVTELAGFQLAECAEPPSLYAGEALPPPVVIAFEARAYGVPRTCVLEFAVSFYKGAEPESVDRQTSDFIEQVCARAGWPAAASRLEPLYRFIPGSAAPAAHPLLGALQRGFAQAERTITITGAPLQCDAHFFNLHFGIPAFILGPAGAGAHTADEWVSVESLLDLARIYAYTIIDWCS